jgi:hypothetical protein
MKRKTLSLSGALLSVVLMSTTVGSGAASLQTEEVPEMLTATTVHMDPLGAALRFTVLSWSSDADRQAAVEAMMDAIAPKAESEEEAESDVGSGLGALPTIGYVWSGSSSVGYFLKYTHRISTPDGGERITFVTDPHLGKYGRTPWAAVGAQAPSDLPFTVIELRLDSAGTGEGTMSVATGITFDETSASVALEGYDTTPTLLADVTRQPPPYWAQSE